MESPAVVEFVYEGSKTREISFPLGGIGSGCIGPAGDERLVLVSLVLNAFEVPLQAHSASACRLPAPR